VVQSPVLVGRDAFLTLAGRRLTAAAAGEGGLLFVAGEAGIGKTRLLSAIARDARTLGFAVARAAAFPGDGQSIAGLLLDLASDLTRSPEPALSECGRSLGARVREVPADAGDAHRRRRLLVQDVVDLLMTVDTGAPLLIVLEDLHWADELSLDVLGHLADRLATRAVLVAGAYRSDELYPQLPMRDLRGRVLSQRLAEEIRLPRLELDQIATMTSATLGRVAPAQVVAAIHARSDGIPLHVEEFLAAIDDGTLTPQSSAAVQAAAVPDTLGDAMLTRARRLTPGTRDVASAAAVIGRSFDFDLLTAVTEAGPDDVAGALRALQEAHFVLPGADPVTFDFRHALIRDALYADTDLPLRRRLHERAARAAVDRGYRDAFVSAHFEQAGCAELAYAHAAAAAAEAAALSAHSEALELYRRAVRNQPPGLPAMDRARLFAAAGDEAAATDDNAAAAEAYQTAHELAAEAGDRRAAAALVPRLVAVTHLLGERLDTRVARLQAALDSLDEVADADRERARLTSALAAAYMLARHLDTAIEHGYRAQRAEQATRCPRSAHAHGLILLARGDESAQAALQQASEQWRARRRFWEGTWARLDLAAAAAKARRRGEAARLVDEARTAAAAAGATRLVRAADELSHSFGGGRAAEPWYPLSAREFEVAELVAAGLTNRQIADRLVLAPKTISAHIAHILAKLGAARRAEIAAWCATIRPQR
jgi:predicted ATPase/DNA-binding CsgD family transcriptional regulator